MNGIICLSGTSELSVIRKSFGLVGRVFHISQGFGGVVTLLLFNRSLMCFEDLVSYISVSKYLNVIGVIDNGYLLPVNFKEFNSQYVGLGSVFCSFKLSLSMLYSFWVLKW